MGEFALTGQFVGGLSSEARSTCHIHFTRCATRDNSCDCAGSSVTKGFLLEQAQVNFKAKPQILLILKGFEVLFFCLFLKLK